jgi:hypothetical protein
LAQNGFGLGAATHLHAFGGIDGANLGQELGRHALGHQQALAGVAGAVLLGFGVVGHPNGHVDVARIVHIGVAIAVQVLDDRHLGFGTDALDQALAPARNDHVHKLGHGDQLAHGGAVGGLHQLHRIHRQAALGQGLLHQLGQSLVRFNRLGAAAQDAGIAALDRQAGRFDGHIGAALENHAEHTDRHTHLPHTDAAGLLLHAQNFADHIGHGRQLLAPLGAGLQHFGAEFEAIDHGLGQALGLGAGQILGVVLLQGFGVFAQQSRQSAQGLVFDGS